MKFLRSISLVYSLQAAAVIIIFSYTPAIYSTTVQEHKPASKKPVPQKITGVDYSTENNWQLHDPAALSNQISQRSPLMQWRR